MSTTGRRMPADVAATPNRYVLILRHPDGREEVGALRRFQEERPRLGHAFSTTVDGEQESWAVVDERIAVDAEGRPFLELVAERDYRELEGLPNHALEHQLARAYPAVAAAVQAAPAGAMEIVALEAGEEPDWDEAARYIDALVPVEVGEDVRALCGVDPEADPPERWLPAVKERLMVDLERFRDDIEGDRNEISEWDAPGLRIFVSVGTWDAEADPQSPHGWMCRLTDSGVLSVAGFERVRKADL